MNRRIVLARRPQGAPVPEDFRLESHPVPAAGPGMVLLRTRYLSLDPYMRGRMNEGPSYAPPVALGAVMTGQTVSVVEASDVARFQPGELVVANVGWQDFGVSDGRDLLKIDVPIMQAGMGGVSYGAIAAAVSEAGGLGSIGCATMNPHFDRTAPRGNVRGRQTPTGRTKR